MSGVHASKDFFSELRRISLNVQSDAAALQQEMLQPPREGAAELLLHNVRSEVRKLKVDAQKAFDASQQDGGFIKACALVDVIMAKQKAALADTEKYLQNYGYVPLDESSAAAKCKKTVSPMEVTEQNTEHSEKSHVGVSNQSDVSMVTPAKCPPPPVDPDRTPQPEDFGLSADILKPRATTYTSSYTASTHTTTASATSMDVDEEPEEFRHRGLCVTPGMMGGDRNRDRNNDFITPYKSQPPSQHYHDTPPPPPSLVTPSLHRIASQIQHTQHTQGDTTGNVLQPDTDTPPFPALATPGLKASMKKQEHQHKAKEVEDDNTPDMPHLRTPGLSLHKARPTHNEEPLPKFQISCVDDGGYKDGSGTPEPPELTMLSLAAMTSSAAVTWNSPHKSAPVVDSPAPFAHVNTHTSPEPSKFPAPSSLLLRNMDFMATPEPPVLTTRLQDIQNYLPANKRLKESTSPPSNEPSASSLPVQQQTKLTGGATGGTSDTSSLRAEACHDKAPEEREHRYREAIRRVGSAEFHGLQESVRRKISMEQLNAIINKLNKFIDIAANIQDCGDEDVELCPDNFREEFGRNIQMVFLVLQCLRRITTKGIHSNSYRLFKHT